MSILSSSESVLPAMSRPRFLPCVVAVLALLLPPAGLASTASNTTIGNTATVNYNDGGGNPQPSVAATASAAVTLVPAAPTLSSPVNQTIAQGSSAILNYTITGTANGPDSYNLAAPVTPTNDSVVTATFSTPIVLGGTTLAAPALAGNTSISVPYDGNPSNTNVNGATLPVGSVIVVGANLYTIASIVKNPGANTALVGLTAAISGATVAAGTIVGEQKTFTVTVPSGTIASGGSGSQSVSLTATSVTAPNPATTQATPTVITVNRPILTVTKLVSTDNGATFAASSNAPPGTSVIYKITATNTGSVTATGVQFADVVPQFLTYVSGSGKFATSAATSYSGATALAEGSGGYTYTSGTSTVAYNPGGATGTVAGGGVLVLFFRATIN